MQLRQKEEGKIKVGSKGVKATLGITYDGGGGGGVQGKKNCRNWGLFKWGFR